MGLTPVGVLGVLLRAKKQGDIQSIKGAMLALRKEVGFFIADSLFEAMLSKADEEL